MRKVLIILVVLMILGGGVWYIAFRPTTTNPITPDDSGFPSFFPLSTTQVPDTIDGQVPTTGSNTPTAQPLQSRLKQLTSRPIAGFTIYPDRITTIIPATAPGGKPTQEVHIEHVLRYVSRLNGYVYEIREKNGVVRSPLQISNIFIPNIYEALFMDKGKTALLRHLRADDRTIATYSVPIPDPNPDNTRTQKEGKYLTENILNAVISPDEGYVARITEEQNMGVVSFTNSLGTKKTELLRFSFAEWIPHWPTQSSLYLQTKASGTADGFLYTFDANKRLKKIIGNIPGLTTSISPSGNLVLYSESTTNSFTTKLYNTKTAATTPLNLSILPEKCAWLTNEDLLCAGNTTVPTGLYPDIWYAGVTPLSDKLYRISTTNNTYEIVYDGAERQLDITQIKVDEDRNLAFFIEKQSGILWQYSL